MLVTLKIHKYNIRYLKFLTKESNINKNNYEVNLKFSKILEIHLYLNQK